MKRVELFLPSITNVRHVIIDGRHIINIAAKPDAILTFFITDSRAEEKSEAKKIKRKT